MKKDYYTQIKESLEKVHKIMGDREIKAIINLMKPAPQFEPRNPPPEFKLEEN